MKVLTKSQIISSSSAHPLEDLFTSFWAAVDARVLNSLDRIAASAAFLSSLLESLVFVVRRVSTAPQDEGVSLVRGTANEETPDVHDALKALLQDQTKRTWEELSSGRLKIEGKDAGAELAKTLASLYRMRPGQ